MPRNSRMEARCVAEKRRYFQPEKYTRARPARPDGRLARIERGDRTACRPSGLSCSKPYETLSELPGPTGHEDAVQDWIYDRWSKFADVRRTSVDNVIANVGGSGRKLLIMGHADEICFMVKSVQRRRVHPPLAVLRRHRVASRRAGCMPLNQPALVLTETGTVPGFFATTSGHVCRSKRRRGRHDGSGTTGSSIWGSARATEAEALGIFPGCRVIWNPKVAAVRRTPDHRQSDGRSRRAGHRHDRGEELAKRDDLAYELVLASTVQEENGLIGAQSIADEIDVDLCLNLDVGLVGDIPGPDKRDFPNKTGCRSGSRLLRTCTAHYSRKLSDRLLGSPKANDIPVQRAIYQQYGSDGAALIKRGIEAALLDLSHTLHPFAGRIGR